MSTTGAETSRPTWHDEIWAGTALFCSMYYIISANATILSHISVPSATGDVVRNIGMPASAVVLGTFLAIIIGNLLGVTLTRTGLMIAPGIGISTFVANFIQSFGANGKNLFGWGDAMLGCALAGVGLIATTAFTDLRSKIIEDLPDSIRRGTKAAIGSLLVTEAFKQYGEFVGPVGQIDPRFGMFMVTIGVGVLTTFFLLRRRLSPAGTGLSAEIRRLGTRVEFVLVIALSSIILHIWQPKYIDSLPKATKLSWLWDRPDVASQIHFTPAALCGWFLLAAVIWFIVVTDIPGTPNEVLPPDIQEADGGRAVWMGYLTDAIAAFLSPVFGTTPTIYYAENQLLREFQCFRQTVGLTAIVWFTLSLAAIGGSTFLGKSAISLEWLLPPFAIIPAVFYIGFLILSAAFIGNNPQPNGTKESRPLEYYIPTAIAAVLTPRLGLEYAFPLSVVSYWLIGSIKRGDGKPDFGPSFIPITCGAIVLIAIVLAIEVFFRH
jgi:xanthine/uracil/vitamin C permease (AzgA family)